MRRRAAYQTKSNLVVLRERPLMERGVEMGGPGMQLETAISAKAFVFGNFSSKGDGTPKVAGLL